jgi:hypothetical protein
VHWSFKELPVDPLPIKVSNVDRVAVCYSPHAPIPAGYAVNSALSQFVSALCKGARSALTAKNQGFIGSTEGKCEPVYTNHNACVALWTRPNAALPNFAGLTAILIGLEIASVLWQWVQGVQVLQVDHAVFNNPPWKLARLGHPIRPLGPTFPK